MGAIGVGPVVVTRRLVASTVVVRRRRVPLRRVASIRRLFVRAFRGPTHRVVVGVPSGGVESLERVGERADRIVERGGRGHPVLGRDRLASPFVVVESVPIVRGRDPVALDGRVVVRDGLDRLADPLEIRLLERVLVRPDVPDRSIPVEDEHGSPGEVRVAAEQFVLEDAVGRGDRAVAVGNERKAEIVLGRERPVAEGGVGRDADDRNVVLEAEQIEVAKRTEFLGTARAEVRRVEEQQDDAAVADQLLERDLSNVPVDGRGTVERRCGLPRLKHATGSEHERHMCTDRTRAAA